MDNGEETRVEMARLVPLHEADRSFDVEFWQAQTSEARFLAACQLVTQYLERHGRADEQRLQRSVGGLRPLRG